MTDPEVREISFDISIDVLVSAILVIAVIVVDFIANGINAIRSPIFLVIGIIIAYTVMKRGIEIKHDKMEV